MRVATLGAEFVEDGRGSCEVVDFPMAGAPVWLEWLESNQNFVVTVFE